MTDLSYRDMWHYNQRLDELFDNLYLYKYENVCLSVCLLTFFSAISKPLGYPWHKVSFRWDSKSEWESDWDSGSGSGSQTGSQSGSESGCELESEEESE